VQEGSASTDTVYMDTFIYAQNSEISADLSDGMFGVAGIDSVWVYINPDTTDSLLRVEDRISASQYEFGREHSNRIFSVREDSVITSQQAGVSVSDTVQVWRLRRHNFSLRPDAGLFDTDAENTVVLEVIDRAGNTIYQTIDVYVRSIDDEEQAIPAFINFPNPFGDHNERGPVTFFRYVLKESSESVSLRIYDLSGSLVNILVRNEAREGGIVYRELWDGRDRFGTPLSNGIYLCELEAGGEKIYTKAAILR
jgi:hypothetical protein